MSSNFASSWGHGAYGAIEHPVYALEERKDEFHNNFHSAAARYGDLSQTLAPPATSESHEPGVPLLGGVPWNP